MQSKVERRFAMKPGKAISVRLKTLRESAGLSQQEVAMHADLSLSLVAKLEQGKKGDPRASTLLALAGALGVKPGAILDDLFPPPAIGVGAPHSAGDAKGTSEMKKKKKKKQQIKEVGAEQSAGDRTGEMKKKKKKKQQIEHKEGDILE
jgi:transcriptional regulator with XRE-family HTH domain